jgi:2-succinyl-5-enolpyruvyl-6-hydroxy-3-cyclohexene-1-carboxylate synthase
LKKVPFLYNMAIIKSIFDLVEVCSQKGIKNAILCPGSRSAVLTIAFDAHPDIRCLSISDERSAGYVALGIAQQTQTPVVLVCTSGTAALNFAPAVAEAFFLEIPLLVLTADRPLEWIDQYDGQTIYQQNLFGQNCKKSYQLAADYANPDTQWFTNRTINEAINVSSSQPQGPVHLNVPIREPFYPLENEGISFDSSVRIIKNITTEKLLSKEAWQELYDTWRAAENKLIVVGQSNDQEIAKILTTIQNEWQIPVVANAISNVPNAIVTTPDLVFDNLNDDEIEIDLLITTGKSVLSKSQKQFLRKCKPKQHWHIQENERIFDTFQTMTHHVQVSASYFFQKLFEDIDYLNFLEGDDEYHSEDSFFAFFEKREFEAQKRSNLALFQPQNAEIFYYNQLMASIPASTILHLGNSMSVRYANLFYYNLQKDVVVYCNRGTSGIDGSLSTAVGAALATDKQVICILGDVSFQYDKNALWNTNLPNNLKIIVMNNGGGNIFRMIAGPKQQHAFKEFFETNQHQNAELLAKMYKLSYYKVLLISELADNLLSFFADDSCAILEIFTQPTANETAFKEFKSLTRNL